MAVDQPRAARLNTRLKPSASQGEPAGNEMVPLAGAQAPRTEEFAAMATQDLHGTEGPPEALFLEVADRVGHQAPSVAARNVESVMTQGQNAQPQFGVFGDAPLGPPAHVLQGPGGGSVRVMVPCWMMMRCVRCG